jgi:hypothetical protein
MTGHDELCDLNHKFEHMKLFIPGIINLEVLNLSIHVRL